MKNCKTFYETQTASNLQEMIHSSPRSLPSDKTLLHLWNKHFLTEIYRNIQTFAFKVLQECSSWGSRNGTVQMFFLTPNRNTSAGKFLKTERFLVALWEDIIFNAKWVEAHKMSEVCCPKLYCKWVIFFASFCWH